MGSFADTLHALVSKEMIAAKRDPERAADVIEHLASALGFSIAIAAGGDPGQIDALLAGAEHYAHEEAVVKAPVAALLRRAGQ